MRSIWKFSVLFSLVLLVPATFAGCGAAGDLAPSESQASPEEEQSDIEVEAEDEMDDSAVGSGEEEGEVEE